MFTALYGQTAASFAARPFLTPALALTAILVIRWVSHAIYQLFFSPVKHYPGPIACRISGIPHSYHDFFGTSHLWRLELHRTYGSVVRVEPKAISVADPAAWRDIYGFKASAPRKDRETYRLPPNNVPSLFAELNDGEHAAQRKIFAHAFSDRALKEQEDMFLRYADTLVQRIRRTISDGPEASIDVVKLLTFATFDIMADLAFGESLGLLSSKEYSPYVGLLLGAFKFGTKLGSIIRFEPWKTLFNSFKPRKFETMRTDHFNFSVERVNKRLELGSDRPDIWGLIMRSQEKGQGLTLSQMHSNSALFMGAGTETTATELSGLLYYLLKNPQCMQKLVAEITTAFPTDDDITMGGIANLEYLQACVEEGLRIYPPVPTALPRVVKEEMGVDIAGWHVPRGITVSMPMYTMSRQYYHDPDSFHPERYLHHANKLDSNPFAHDDIQAHQPFLYGPRNCLGKNMAYHEIRLVLVMLLWNFDFTLGDGMSHWAEKQKSYAIWEKSPLMVKVQVRKKSS